MRVAPLAAHADHTLFLLFSDHFFLRNTHQSGTAGGADRHGPAAAGVCVCVCARGICVCIYICRVLVCVCVCMYMHINSFSFSFQSDSEVLKGLSVGSVSSDVARPIVQG